MCKLSGGPPAAPREAFSQQRGGAVAAVAKEDCAHKAAIGAALRAWCPMIGPGRWGGLTLEEFSTGSQGLEEDWIPLEELANNKAEGAGWHSDSF